MNSPECCQASTTGIGMGQATSEELRWGGKRVELYKCIRCGRVSRFPRYNHPEKLMQTRTGRCGEWANVFTLFCYALGYKTRYVLDYTDHVWTEIYIDRTRKWTHADSCEAALDKPLIYELGWNKKLTFIFSFSRDYVVDVIPRYSNLKPDLYERRRREVGERCLGDTIRFVNQRVQGGVLQELEMEKRALDELRVQRIVKGETVVMQGRQSGSTEWRSARGEIGGTRVQPGFELEWQRKTMIEPGRFSLGGSARNSASGIILTPNRPDQCGSGFFDPNISRNGQEWSVRGKPVKGVGLEFSIRMTRDGADGMAFVVQSVGLNAIGTGGCGLGYVGIPKSLAVEFDTVRV
jgi:peptide-N4-(N-acetyl-beta-glucosaminyl)asparagine amidase